MTDTKPNTPDRISVRSADFRYIPCDSINLGLSDNGVKLLFGVEEMDNTTLELIGIHMTHRTAMILQSALAQILDQYQTDTGIKIPTPTLNTSRLK